MTDIYAQTPPPIVCNGMNYKVFFISLSHPSFETLGSLIFYYPFYFSHCNKALSGLIYQDLFVCFFLHRLLIGFRRHIHFESLISTQVN